MDRRPLLLTTLLLLATALAGGSAWRFTALQRQLADGGPQALARDGQGGLFLATDRTLLHLDGNGTVRARYSAATLGLQSVDALAAGEDDTLFIHDREQRRLFRCAMASARCLPFGSAALGLGDRVHLAWLFGPDRRLLVADTARDRLLALDANGATLPGTSGGWRSPRQLQASGEHVWLADSGTGRIVTLDATGTSQRGVALQARAHPLRFIRRDTDWWVLEADARGAHPVLRHYRHGLATDLVLPVTEPAFLVDLGRCFVVAARSDWRLLAVDPDSGTVSPFGSDALMAAFSAQRAAIASAREEQRWLPVVMAAALVPAFLAGLLLWRRAGGHRGTTAAASSAPLPARGIARIEACPDARGRPVDQLLLLGPDKLVHLVAGRPVRAAAYRDLRMNDRSLQIGRYRLPLVAGRGSARRALWPVDTLRQAIVARLGGPLPEPMPSRRPGLATVMAGAALLLLLVLLLQLWHTGQDSPALLAGRLLP